MDKMPYSLVHITGRAFIYVRFWDESKRKYGAAVSSKRTTDKLAEIWAANELVARAARRAAADLTNITFGEWAKRFYTDDCPHAERKAAEGRPITEYRRQVARTQVKKILEDKELCDRPLAKITRNEILDARRRLFDRLTEKGQVMDDTWRVLRVIFAEATFRDIIPRDPSQRVGPVARTKRVKGILTREQLRALFDRASWPTDDSWLAFVLLVLTGMRQGEVRALRWESIDWEHKRILVREAVKAGPRYVIGGTKSKKDRPPAISPALLKILKTRFDQGSGAGLVLRSNRRGPYSRTWFPWAFDEACGRIGIDRRAANITPHSIRHSVVTLAIGAGADRERIRAVVGHEDEKTQDMYLHPENWDFAQEARLIQGAVLGDLEEDEETAVVTAVVVHDAP